MAGIDFLRAPIARREPVSFVRGQVSALLPRLAQAAHVTGCVLLATCNRTELYVHTDGTAVDPLVLLCREAGVSADAYRAISVVRKDAQAASHLMAVAAGLESQIFGDDQIITQVRDAAALSREAGTSDSVLDTLFRRAVTAGKRVKTEVRLTGVPASAAERGVARAADFFGSLAGKRAVVIGNGEMGRLAATALHAAGCQVTVTLRTYRHGQTIVPAGCATHPYEDRCAILEGAHLVVSATTSPHYTLTRAQVDALDRPPVLFIDLAMPRDLDEAIAGREGVVMWNLDDLGDLPGQDDGARQAAQSILDEAMEDFTAWYDYRQSLPLIAALKDTALMRLRYDHAYAGLCEDNDLDGLAALAVQKTVDLMLGGMKGIVSPERLTACLEHMKKGSGK